MHQQYWRHEHKETTSTAALNRKKRTLISGGSGMQNASHQAINNRFQELREVNLSGREAGAHLPNKNIQKLVALVGTGKAPKRNESASLSNDLFWILDLPQLRHLPGHFVQIDCGQERAQ